jgi:hypothetical protein
MATNGRKSDHGNGKLTPVVVFIGEMTRELSHLARSDGCVTLSYLLELATLEAEGQGRRSLG